MQNFTSLQVSHTHTRCHGNLEVKGCENINFFIVLPIQTEYITVCFPSDVLNVWKKPVIPPLVSPCRCVISSNLNPGLRTQCPFHISCFYPAVTSGGTFPSGTYCMRQTIYVRVSLLMTVLPTEELEELLKRVALWSVGVVLHWTQRPCCLNRSGLVSAAAVTNV